MAARRSDGLRTERRILSVCVRLFLEQGYHQTTLQQVYDEAHVSASSFQNLFGSKDGVLLELEKFMFENQFDLAQSITSEQSAELPPLYVYSVETAIQLTLTELNENIRDVYVEAYSFPESMEFINRATAKRLFLTFGPYQPELDEADFYVRELGTSGMMRGFMAKPCTDGFTLEMKVASFLELALRGFKVPEAEVQQVLATVEAIDIRNTAQKVMEELFKQLAMHYEFSLDGIQTKS